jgi:molybdate transport system substrate-binding protein
MQELVRRYELQTPRAQVSVTYGASGELAAQLERGAPFDLFFSADVSYVDQGLKSGWALPPAMIYGSGRLVLWLPKTSKLDPASGGLGVLLDSSVKKIAIANPRHAPYGRISEAALKAAKIYEGVSSKLVEGENVAQAAQFAQSGAADAALIPASLALWPQFSKDGRIWEVPHTLYPELTQEAAVVKPARGHAKNEKAARQFLKFVQSQASWLHTEGL